MVTTLIARRAQLHQVYLVANVIPGRTTVAGATAGLSAQLLASGVQANFAARKAYALLYQTVIAQATTLAYVDTYMVLAMTAAIMFVLAFALNRNQPGGGRVVME